MAKSRPKQTLADYVAIAISPALIMVLVGSLVFFLQEVGYSGQYSGRLNWILFWFVFAAVLIARIGIEEGEQHAAVFTLAFWGAVSLVVLRFMDQPLVGFALLGVTWWCAKKLTWDCTLIDDSQDATGQGLLQTTGLDPDEESAPASNTPDEPTNPDDESQDSSKNKSSQEKTPHAPGVWVVYFSLAALPLFGIGQVFIPAAETARRAAAFRYLWCYVAAGLGLLLTTSFLGLRRYLRQRKLTMPASITRRWIGMGSVFALGILIVCVLLPRPQATYSMTKVVDTVSESIGKASDYALGSEDAGEGEGRHAGREATEEESKNQEGEGQKGKEGKTAGKDKSQGQASNGKGDKSGKSQSQGDKSQKQDDQSNQSGKENQGNKQPGEQTKSDHAEQSAQQADEKNGDDKSSNSNSTDSPSSQPSSSPSGSLGSQIATMVKWLIYLGIAVAAVIYAIRYWDRIRAGLIRFWQDLKDLFAGLFGKKTDRTPEKTMGDSAGPMESPIRPFAEFSNPFQNGMEQSLTTEELIEYSFDALKAWAAENGCVKSPDQTPGEFAQLLSHQIPELATEARLIAKLYQQAAFSPSPPGLPCHPQLKKIWARLERTPAVTP